MLMSERASVSVPAEVGQAREQFESWRRERKRGEAHSGEFVGDGCGGGEASGQQRRR